MLYPLLRGTIQSAQPRCLAQSPRSLIRPACSHATSAGLGCCGAAQLRLGTCCACALADSKHVAAGADGGTGASCASTTAWALPRRRVPSVPAPPLAQVQQARVIHAQLFQVCCVPFVCRQVAATFLALRLSMRHSDMSVTIISVGRLNGTQAQWKTSMDSLLPPDFQMSTTCNAAVLAQHQLVPRRSCSSTCHVPGRLWMTACRSTL